MDFIEKMVEELCWSVISQDTAWTLVLLVRDAQNIFITVAFDRCPFGDVIPQEAIVPLVLRTFP